MDRKDDYSDGDDSEGEDGHNCGYLSNSIDEILSMEYMVANESAFERALELLHMHLHKCRISDMFLNVVMHAVEGSIDMNIPAQASSKCTGCFKHERLVQHLKNFDDVMILVPHIEEFEDEYVDSANVDVIRVGKKLGTILSDHRVTPLSENEDYVFSPMIKNSALKTMLSNVDVEQFEYDDDEEDNPDGYTDNEMKAIIKAFRENVNKPEFEDQLDYYKLQAKFNKKSGGGRNGQDLLFFK